jgi:hypothetical protein
MSLLVDDIAEKWQPALEKSWLAGSALTGYVIKTLLGPYDDNSLFGAAAATRTTMAIWILVISWWRSACRT